jgi:hypothetical protein
MIPWKRYSIFQLLCLFGDDKPHGWVETINLGTRLFVNYPAGKFKTHQAKFEAFLQKAIEYGIIDMTPTDYIINARKQTRYMISKEDYNYKLSKKGDELLRQEQAERESDKAFYYRQFDRTVEGKFGADYFSPLTPTDYGVKEKHSYKINPNGNKSE